MPTEQELTEFWGKLKASEPKPQPGTVSTIENVKAIAKKLEISGVEVAKRAHEIFTTTKALQSLKDEAKYYQTAKILYAQLRRQISSGGDADLFEILVVEALPTRDFIYKTGKNKGKPGRAATVLGVGTRIREDGKDPTAFVTIALFGNIAEKFKEAMPGKVYRTLCRGEFKEGAWNLFGFERTSFAKHEEGKDMNPIEVLKKLFPTVLIKDASNNISKGPNDLKIVHGDVVYGRVDYSEKSEGYYGRYAIQDNSISAEVELDAEMKGDKEQIDKNRALFNIMARDPSQVRHGEGSTLMFLGTISKNEEYPVGMQAVCVVPEFSNPEEYERPEPPAKPTPGQVAEGSKAASSQSVATSGASASEFDKW